MASPVSKLPSRFGEVVQLLHIDRKHFRALEHREKAIDFLHLAVRFGRVADLQRLQQLHAVRVLVAGDGERDGRHAVFWVIGVTENRSNHHVISSVFLSRFKTTSPYLHSRSAPRMSRKALSLTSSEKARSSITMLSPPTEMVFAA